MCKIIEDAKYVAIFKNKKAFKESIELNKTKVQNKGERRYYLNSNADAVSVVFVDKYYTAGSVT